MRLSHETIKLLADHGDETAHTVLEWCKSDPDTFVVSNDTHLCAWELHPNNWIEPEYLDKRKVG